MGLFKYEDCPLKHYVRLEGWLPFAKRRLRIIRAGRKVSQQRRLRYFTFCAVGALDVLMLDVARVIRKNDGRFDNVVFFDRTKEHIIETQRRIPGAVGFPGKFTLIVNDEDPAGDAQVEAEEPLSENTGQLDEKKFRERQRRLAIRKDFRMTFPFDVINLDLEEFLFKQRDQFPGQVVRAMKRVFEWQRQPILGLRGRREYLTGFTLMFTTQIGPVAMHPDYLRMLRKYLEDNITNQPGLLDQLHQRAGLRDIDQLLAERFDLFFKLSVPKVIAAMLLEEDWYIDPNTGVTTFQFDRDSADGSYTLLHIVMDVNRQKPDRDNRMPNTTPPMVTNAYDEVVRRIFEVPERVVVRDELDLESINKSLAAIFARRRMYCPDESQPPV